MRACLIAAGEELLLGRTVDTNSSWLARRLTDLGLAVTGMRIVGDVEADLVAALDQAAGASELVLITGGLGPTEDDRTRHALALVSGKALQESAVAWRQIVRTWSRVRPGQEPPLSNRRQALVPRTARILANDRGTAPGLLLRHHGAWIASMPGVPHEMQAMWLRLEARLPRLLPGLQPPALEDIHIAGVGESRVQDLLGDLLAGEDPVVGICAHEAGHITIRPVGRPAAVRRRARAIRGVLKPWLLPAAGLAPSLVALLTQRRATIACAESCTGGRIAALLTAVAGSSAVIHHARVVYDAAAKTSLGVPPDLIRQHGVVSEAVAAAMARAMRLVAGSDLAVACTGWAGPDGGSRSDPIGTVYVAAADRRHCAVRRVVLRGERERVQHRAAVQALLLAWDVLHGRTTGNELLKPVS